MIPKKIWTCWFGDEMPEYIVKIIRTQNIPDYEHTLIWDGNLPANIPEYVKIALANKKWVKAKDYLQAWILQREGGIFLDADQEILPGKNFDDLLHMELFSGREENGFVANSLIGSVPHHPLWEEYFKQVDEKFTPLDGKEFESAMEIFTHLMYSDNYDSIILEPDFFFPYNHQTGIINVTPNTRTFHHFMKSWTNISPDILPTVSIIIPQLGRPEGLQLCLDSIDRLYYPKHLIETLIIEGDETVPMKVDKGLKQSKGEYVVYAANDIEFEPNSLYEAISLSREELAGKPELVAFNTGKLLPDLGNICEHFIIKKSLIEKLENKQIFSTDFHHVGSDNWLWAQAIKLGTAVRDELAIVHHYHFSTGAPDDEIYKKGWSNVEQDREILKKKLKAIL